MSATERQVPIVEGRNGRNTLIEVLEWRIEEINPGARLAGVSQKESRPDAERVNDEDENQESDEQNDSPSARRIRGGGALGVHGSRMTQQCGMAIGTKTKSRSVNVI